ncbi:hypothetical protein Tco_0382266 [Tanacetum coccineum]
MKPHQDTKNTPIQQSFAHRGELIEKRIAKLRPALRNDDTVHEESKPHICISDKEQADVPQNHNGRRSWTNILLAKNDTQTRTKRRLNMIPLRINYHQSLNTLCRARTSEEMFTLIGMYCSDASSQAKSYDA